MAPDHELLKGILKRRKNNALNGRRNDKANASQFVKHRYKRQKVALDGLNWKSVDNVDSLEDFEGFYGLEEVDDVQVVRQDGLVTFEVQQNEVNSHAADHDSAGEWEGFEDDNATPKDSVQRRSLGDGHETATAKMAEDEDGLGHLSFQVLDPDHVEAGSTDGAWLPLDLSSQVLDSIARLSFKTPTPIQVAAIPAIISGQDVIGKAQTGSGKTLAYGIPIIETYLRQSQRSAASIANDRGFLALIIAPTRELASQVATHLRAFCMPFAGPTVVTVTGGLSLQKQQRHLLHADIVIATPGRLWEIMESSKDVLKKLLQIKFLVLDEADRLLSEGHFQELSQILNALDRQDDDLLNGDSIQQRQTLVFSATFHEALQKKLSSKKQIDTSTTNQQQSMSYLMQKLKFKDKKPRFIDVDPSRQVAQGIKEGLLECAGLEKDLYLYSMIMLHPRTRTLVFTNSISAVKRLTPLLQNLNVPANMLHSAMTQKARLRNVERFSTADASTLVATDVAARGLDIPGVQLIIHYHLPRTADTYVHRSGRTARGENTGASIVLCAPEEVNGLRRLVARVHAQAGVSNASGIPTIPLDRKVASKLKPRVQLAKKLADVNVAKVKNQKENDFLREAAEDLGVEYDSEEMDAIGGGKRGRGNQRKARERRDRETSKEEMVSWRAELQGLLNERVNLGISKRYIAQGVVDVDALLQKGDGDFLGAAPMLHWDAF